MGGTGGTYTMDRKIGNVHDGSVTSRTHTIKHGRAIHKPMKYTTTLGHVSMKQVTKLQALYCGLLVEYLGPVLRV